jgi:hypothetical protein
MKLRLESGPGASYLTFRRRLLGSVVKKLYLSVPSFSCEDEMAPVGRKYHMACYGVFRQNDGTIELY